MRYVFICECVYFVSYLIDRILHFAFGVKVQVSTKYRAPRHSLQFTHSTVSALTQVFSSYFFFFTYAEDMVEVNFVCLLKTCRAVNIICADER